MQKIVNLLNSKMGYFPGIHDFRKQFGGALARYWQYFVACALLGALVSCDECEPVTDPGNILRVAFVDPDLEPVDTSFVSVYGLGRSDSVLFKESPRRAVFSLPLNFRRDTTAFVFRLLPEEPPRYDTLWVAYRRFTVLNGPNCSFYEQYDQIQLLRPFLESAEVVQPVILLTDEPNIRIIVKR